MKVVQTHTLTPFIFFNFLSSKQYPGRIKLTEELGQKMKVTKVMLVGTGTFPGILEEQS